MRFLHVAGRAFGAPLLPAPRPGLAMLASLGAYVRRRGSESAEADVLRLKAWGDGGEPRGRTASRRHPAQRASMVRATRPRNRLRLAVVERSMSW